MAQVDTMAAFGLLVVLMWVGAPAQAAACADVDGIESICGLQAPEDIVRLPGSHYLLVSEMTAAGSLTAINSQDQSITRLYSGGTEAPQQLWGDANCSQPPRAITPHGLDIRRRDDGRWQLFVVNHGQRESVELFEVQPQPDQAPALHWRGCVVGDDSASFNDVAGLSSGEFLVTHTADRRWELLDLLLSAIGFDRGRVYHWRPATGLQAVPNSEGEYPNGIILAPDDSSFYVNLYLGNKVRQHDFATGEVLAELSVSKPDNFSWSESGQLLVASHEGDLFAIGASLNAGNEQPSELPFAILAIDPASLQLRTVLRREGPPMGAATVALQVGDWLYLGSYVGDRIVRLPVADSL